MAHPRRAKTLLALLATIAGIPYFVWPTLWVRGRTPDGQRTRVHRFTGVKQQHCERHGWDTIRPRQTPCMANVKQPCLAAIMYSEDHADTFPLGYNGLPWWVVIDPYLRNEQLLRCPELKDNGIDRAGRGAYAELPGTPRQAVGYGWNCGTASGGWTDGMGATTDATVPGGHIPVQWTPAAAVPVSVEDVAEPSSTLLVTDIAPDSSLAMFSFHAGPSADRYPQIHDGGANCGYVDGHAKWQEASTLASNARWYTRRAD